MTLFGSLEIGKSGIIASRSGQNTTGHNIANVGTPGYTRQELQQSPFSSRVEGLEHGTKIDGVRRIHDEFTNRKLIEQVNLAENWKTRTDLLKKAELSLIGPDGETLTTAINDFWSSWERLVNAPEDFSVRTDVLRAATKLSDQIRTAHRSIQNIRLDISKEIEQGVKEINASSKEIAKLNKIIQNLEARKANANDFRDKRDQLVEKISKWVDIERFETPKNHMNVLFGSGYSLVSQLSSYEVKLSGKFKEGGMDGIGIQIGSDLFDLSKSLKTGKIAEMLQVRDEDLKNYNDFLDEFASTLSQKVNKIHSGATGLETKRRFDKGSLSFDSAEQKISLPGVRTGNLELLIFDNQGKPLNTIVLDFREGIDRPIDLVDQINEKAKALLPEPEKEDEITDPQLFEPLVTAKFNQEGKIEITGSKRSIFAYGKDSSGILAATGMQSFFEGDSAKNIRINPLVEENPRLISAGYEGNPGDNRAAFEIFGLKDQLLMKNGTSNFEESYNTVIGDLGMEIQKSNEKTDYHTSAKDQYQQLHDSFSGVNLDEELTNMVKYQRAYEASAKYISTVDEMTQTLLNMKR